MPVIVPINESNVGVMPYNQNVWINITTDAELVSYKHNYRIKISIGNSEESSSEFFKENDRDYSYFNLSNKNPNNRNLNHLNDDSKKTNIYLPFIIAFSIIYRYEIINYMENPSDQTKSIIKRCLKELGRKVKYNDTSGLRKLADDAWLLRNPGKDPNK